MVTKSVYSFMVVVMKKSRQGRRRNRKKGKVSLISTLFIYSSFSFLFGNESLPYTTTLQS
jgi:hypothetical protein